MEAIFIAAATSADILAAVIGLQSSGIKLPYYSAAAVSLTGALILCVSVAAADFVNKIAAIGSAVYISKLILMLIGIKTIKGALKGRGAAEELSCINVLSHPERADRDCSKSISVKEGVVLGFALSADSVFTGIGAGIGGMSPLLILVLSFVFAMAACGAGAMTARLLSKKLSSTAAAAAGGVVLLIIALII